MSVTAVLKAKVDKKADSIIIAEEILNYYEKMANISANDREFIIKRGFHEWLLAAVGGYTANTAKGHFKNIPLHPSVESGSEIITLIANLIGGITNGTK